MEKNNSTPVSISSFEEGLKHTSPMPLYDVKKEKSAYEYFRELGNTLAESISSGKSPLLPGKDGFVDLHPAYNVNNNTKVEGLTQIMLLTKAAELNSPSNGFVTFDTISKAQKAGVDCKIAKNSKAVVIPIVDDKNWGEIKFKNKWFNLSQIENSEKLVSWCKEKMSEQYKKDVQYINEHYPNSTFKEKKNPAERVMDKPNNSVLPLNEKTEEPYQYLAQVLNAVDSGRKLYVTPEQAENFKNKTVELLNAEYEPGKRDVTAIKKLCNSAEYLYSKNKKYIQEHFLNKENSKEVSKQSHKKSQKRDVSYERSM